MFETISRWLKSHGAGWIEVAPYEELFRRYAQANVDEKRQIYEEFSRRLSRLVFRAAHDYVKRKKRHESEDEVSKLKDQVFRSFVPEMAAGDPAFGLRRFATHIRDVLDK